jgi:hypothetical protein
MLDNGAMLQRWVCDPHSNLPRWQHLPFLGAAALPQAADTLRDIKPPVELPDPWKWAMIALAALIACAVAWFLWREWKKRRAQVPSIPVIPAHVRARRKLEEALALISQPREFCTLVSDTIRGYLEERFSFHAPERTTEEFLYELRETNLLTPDQKDGLGEFLKRCDLVKFARYEPREPELRDLHDSALRLVEETEPVEPETSAGTQYASRNTEHAAP